MKQDSETSNCPICGEEMNRGMIGYHLNTVHYSELIDKDKVHGEE